MKTIRSQKGSGEIDRNKLKICISKLNDWKTQGKETTFSASFEAAI